MAQAQTQGHESQALSSPIMPRDSQQNFLRWEGSALASHGLLGTAMTVSGGSSPSNEDWVDQLNQNCPLHDPEAVLVTPASVPSCSLLNRLWPYSIGHDAH